jgi:RND family efflux transporter MFP subunit
LIVIGLAVGLVPRWLARRALAKETVENAVQTVAVVSPSPGKSDMGVPLPAEVQAFVEAPIYARANGYLKRWDVDIGEHVEAGQLLAEIDTPEVDQQLEQAKAEVAQADANLALAKSTSERWVDLLKTASVSEQETAEKQADFALKKANLEAARANLHRLEDLKSFARVTAPFAGTITTRDTDVGQLIVAGNARALFRLAQTNPLRVYVRVPQTLSRAIEVGQGAELTISELPGRKFEAKIVRTAGAMDPSSRTLLAELEVKNPKNEILAGSYAQVRFNDTAGDPTLTLPASTLLFRSEGMQVGVVDSNGKVEVRTVKLGRDFGQTLEIVDGVTAGDRVIVNPPDMLASGMTVRVAEPTNVAAK